MEYSQQPSVAWNITDELVPYREALTWMQDRVAAIDAKTESECVWLLTHPPLYTAGTSAKAADLINGHNFPVYDAGRGGQYTYHGPGQRVAYVMLDLKRIGQDVRGYVWRLEEWIIQALAMFNIQSERRADRPGVWVRRTDLGQPRREDKIAAIGVRLRRWVSFHGIAINVDPDLSHYEGIVPCGIHQHGVTSFADLGLTTQMAELDMALQHCFAKAFDTEIQPPLARA